LEIKKKPLTKGDSIIQNVAPDGKKDQCTENVTRSVKRNTVGVGGTSVARARAQKKEKSKRIHQSRRTQSRKHGHLIVLDSATLVRKGKN